MLHKFPLSIPIPLESKVAVKVGDKVSPGTLLAQESSQQITEINLSTALGVSPKEIGKYLTVALGKEVNKGATLASRQGLFGNKEVMAPVAGVLQKISEESGVISLRTGIAQGKKVVSPVAGEVVAVTSGEKRIDIEVSGRVWEGEKAWGAPGWGPLAVVGQWGTLKLDQLTLEEAGKIVIIADKVNLGWLSKAAALDVAGVVCAGLRNGSDEVPPDISLLVLAADDNGQMDRKIWDELNKFSGKIAAIDTQKKFLGVVE